MSHRKLLTLLLVLLVSLALISSASAQTPGDRDGDGLTDTADRCPNQAGPRENGGCPLPTTPRAADDRDGDGVADFVDQCPDQPGTGFTNGCPVGVNVTPLVNPTLQGGQIQMVWDTMDECMVGVPLTANSNVNVREQPTINSAIIGQLGPGAQWSPWFRDYDENLEVWFAGAFVNGQYGWVKGDVVINNGQCVNLPQVIHVDAPDQTPEIIVEFDPSLIPQEWRDEEDDGFSLADLLGDIGPIVVDITDWDIPIPTPVPGESRPGQADPPDPDALPIFDFSDGMGIIVVMPTDQIPTDQLPAVQRALNFAHRMRPGEECLEIGGGFCLDASLLLPAVGEEPGQCTPEGLNALLGSFVGDPFVGDPFDGDPNGFLGPGEITDGTLIGLLLPAVQKVREAAARMHTGGELLQDFHFLLADGSVIPSEAMQDFNFLLGDGSVRPSSPCLIGLLLPAVQKAA